MISSMNVIMVALNAVELPVRAMAPSYKKVAAMPCADPCTCRDRPDAARASAELETISQSDRAAGRRHAHRHQRGRRSHRQTTPASARAPRQGPPRQQEFLASPRASLFSSSLEKKGCKHGLPVEDDTFHDRLQAREEVHGPSLPNRLADETSTP